jgi:hypothetical protein
VVLRGGALIFLKELVVSYGVVGVIIAALFSLLLSVAVVGFLLLLTETFFAIPLMLVIMT